MVTLRLTKVPFGSGPSPFILGATLGEHLKNSEEKYQETVAELKKNVYVDDVISGVKIKINQGNSKTRL